MILVDTFDSDAEAVFLVEVLKKNAIQFEEKNGDSGLQLFINEADESKLNELIKALD
jgi:hypothetical protein